MLEKSIDLIQEELNRVREEEGYSIKDDDIWTEGQLADAAICYLMDPDTRKQIRNTGIFPWPFKHELFKPSTRVRDLVKAGQFVCAELTRVLREPLEETGTDWDKIRNEMFEILEQYGTCIITENKDEITVWCHLKFSDDLFEVFDIIQSTVQYRYSEIGYFNFQNETLKATFRSK